MWTLFKYELKKIFSSKTFLISTLMLFAFITAISIMPVITGGVQRRDLRSVLKGRAIDDELLKELSEAEDENIYVDITDFIEFSTGRTYASIKGTDEATFTAEKLYQDRMDGIYRSFNDYKLTQEETDYWLEKEKDIVKPIIYDNDDAYSELFSIVYVGNFVLLIVLAIGITGVFADEKATGADAIILSCKNGRTTIFTAKILASLTTGFLISFVMYTVLMLINFGVYGTGGFNTAIQLRIPGCMLNISVGQAALIMFGLFVLLGITYGAISAFLSVLVGNHSAATGVMVVMMFLTMFNIPEKYRIASQIWQYLPTGSIGSWKFSDYRLVNIFGCQLNVFEISPIIWFVLIVILIRITKKLYKKSEVCGR